MNHIHIRALDDVIYNMQVGSVHEIYQSYYLLLYRDSKSHTFKNLLHNLILQHYMKEKKMERVQFLINFFILPIK